MMKVRALAHPGLGQTAAIDICTPVSLIGSIPAVGTLVKSAGCSPLGKAAIAAGLATAVSPSGPGTTILTSLGVQTVVDCLCRGQPTTPYVPPPPPPWYSNPVVIVAVLAGIAAVGYGLSRRRGSTPAPAKA